MNISANIEPHTYRDAAGIDADAVLAMIRRIVEVESPTSDKAGVNRVLDVLAGHFRDTGAMIERLPTPEPYGDMLRVRSDPARQARGILVLAHVDTVHPLGTLAGALPFRRDGDKVFGPGIYDMKGCLILAVAAFQRIVAAGRRTPLPITFLFTPDEEVGSPVSRQTIEDEAEKNRYVLVVEPAREGGKIVTARKGIGRFVIRTKGRPAHAGSAHDKGRNAIRAMAEIILKIEGFTDYTRGITTSCGLIHGGTAANTIPEDCVMEADLRVCDRASADEMVAKFHALTTSVPDVAVSVTGGLNRPPFARDAKIDALFAQAAVIARDIGFELVSYPLAGGGSDGNFTVDRGIATLDGLGVDGADAHTHHEHLLYSSITPRLRLLQGLMETLG